MRWYVWPLFALIMGFAIGGSFVSSVFYPPNELRHSQANYQSKQDSQASTPNKEPDSESFWVRTTDDPVAFFTGVLALFTLVLAVSTVGLWIVTQSIFRDGQVTTEKQLRAYVHVVRVKIEHVSDGYTPTVNVKFMNFGQTLARFVVCNLEVAFGFGGPFKKKNVNDTHRKGFELGPQQDAEFSGFFSLDHIGGLREALNSNLFEMYVSGTIEYVDVFNKRRLTNFNFKLHVNPEGLEDSDAFTMCEDGNDSSPY